MAARDNLNPDQLKMFMSPREIGASVYAYGDFGPNNKERLPHEQPGARFKIHNAQESGMAESIAKEGVKHPVALSHDNTGMTTVNGHHRLSVQSSVDPDRLMPVSHWDRRKRTSMEMFNGDITQEKDPSGERGSR